MTDVFAEARRLVTSREVAEANGLRPNKNSFICCPLHGEKTPSLKLYENGSWHCFGCNRGGSVIDFVSQLYGLDALGAVRRLNDDFHLGLPLDRKQTPAERREAEQAAQHRQEVNNTFKDFEEWRDNLTRQLNACFRLAHLTMKGIKAPEDFDRLTDQQIIAIQQQSYIEYLSDLLLSGSMEDMMQIFRERREISRLVETILNHSPMKSGAA